MVHQFKFSEGKKKGHFNNTIYTYINNLRTAKKNPSINDEIKAKVEKYFEPILKKLEINSRKH